MYIKDIIIDGFKSYATRTEIKSFDPQFSAITGLNGSGKSNILDAILFVLGLSHFQLARVSNLQELVYKFGHAGITKASVTIIFDNLDKKSSPPGFENMDTITVTRQISQGKSKYFLNGHNESNSKIKSLFKAVQLNIDNPHFLVQQGRITKIINLKPSELISMLEETAGTALYNEKKKEALRTIQKKEEKVKEINGLLTTEIEPQMEKLKKEKETFYLWKSIDVEIQKLDRQLRAYEYMNKLNILRDRGVEVENIKITLEERKAKKEDAEKSLKTAQEKLNKYINEQKSQESSEYTKLVADRDSLDKDILKRDLKHKNMLKSLDESEKELQEKENIIQKNERSVASHNQKISFSERLLKDRETEYKDRKTIYDEALRNVQACARGDTALGDAEYTIKNQLKEVKRNSERTQTEIIQLQKKLDFLEKELDTSKSAIETSKRDKDHNNSQIDIIQKELIQIENEINSLNINESLLGNLMEEHRHTSERLMHANHKIREICESDNAFATNFRDPEPNFDRRRVKGRVFDLVYPVEEKYLKALDQVAGGKLRNIVVDNEQTSKLLMKKQCFNHFVNLMPNTKMIPQSISENIIKEAERIAKEAGGFAIQASKLVKYDSEIKNSIEFVFGGTLVCSSTEVAKRIISRDINVRCVTLDGDIHDPKGSLTGGYLNLASSVLMKNEEVRKLKQEQEMIQKDLRDLEEKIGKIKKDLAHKEGLKQDFEQKSHRLNLLKEKSKRNSGQGIEKKMTDLQGEREVILENIDALKARLNEYEKEIKDLEADLSSSSSSGGHPKKSQKDLWVEKSKKLEAEMEKIQKDIKKTKDDIISMEVEKDNAEHEIRSANANLESLKVLIKDLMYQKEEMTLNITDLKRKRETYERQIKAFEKESTLHDSQIKELRAKIDDLTKLQDTCDKEIKKCDALIARNIKEIKELTENIAADERKFSFLLQEKANLGAQGSEFDFSSFDFEQMQNHYNRLKQDQQGLQKRVNQKVEAMFDKVEKEFRSLIEKRETIKIDKDTLSNGMVDLDQKRKEAVEKCYIGVNKNFGKIFSTLLPGTSAKIQTTTGKDIQEGLEISVAFNNVWKTSLSELSGGQRSLLALSFMLSLLLYKPAPFYILDEIDAALDLSHTENIGTMISQHFPQSQFIIISLKEGMFNNANVLFKTQFLDGVSKVERRALKSKKFVVGENSEEGKRKKQKKPVQIMETE